MEAPFYIGQRVVCVRSHRDSGGCKEGLVYIVRDVRQSPCCKQRIQIDIGLTANHYNSYTCYDCNILVPVNLTNIWWFMASRFAPITPREVEIDEAIIEQAEEMVSVKETVLEPVLN